MFDLDAATTGWAVTSMVDGEMDIVVCDTEEDAREWAQYIEDYARETGAQHNAWVTVNRVVGDK